MDCATGNVRTLPHSSTISRTKILLALLITFWMTRELRQHCVTITCETFHRIPTTANRMAVCRFPCTPSSVVCIHNSQSSTNFCSRRIFHVATSAQKRCQREMYLHHYYQLLLLLPLQLLPQILIIVTLNGSPAYCYNINSIAHCVRKSSKIHN